ncbi:MAG: hypothetical protein WAU21_13205 [Chitinophagales bacterium]|nr:hypothetical protein [Bacteroidota bacterium]MBK8487409.1 hypothetical protein [Bacteroidota bacterium]MBK8682848.1 hypothetical protein [Bacteroidota bacterium]
MKQYPYSFQIALDGNGINGLEGMAGVCNFLFDPSDNSFAFKVKYFNGMAGGHAVSLSPDGKHGYMGTSGQHLALYDPHSLNELDRITTLNLEINDTSIRGSTHVAWLNSTEFIAAIGDYFYKFNINNLRKGEKLGAHKLMLPHSMKFTASKKYLCYGSMDNPTFGKNGEAKMVGVLDMETGEATKIDLPATCWHLIPHPQKDIFYAVSFRVLPQDHQDYHEWAIAFFKEYAFEIDAKEKRVLRHWCCSREIPSHINSDVTISDTELIFCNGGSHTIVFIDLNNFSDFRMIDEKPDFSELLNHKRTVSNTIFDVMLRGGVFTSTKHILTALRVSRFRFMDSIHACQLSDNQQLLFTANRGMNHITIYDYPSLNKRIRVNMPDIQEFTPYATKMADPRLGFHHSYLKSPV